MNLPVNPTQLDTRCFVHLNQVGAHAPFPQVQIPPRIGNNYAFILYLLTLDVQQNGNRHPPRTFFTNLVTQNNWQNPVAQNLVATTFEVVEYYLSTQQGNPQQIAEYAVAEIVPMMVALTVSQYADGMRQFLNQDSANAINNALNQFNNLRGQIQQFYQYQNQNTGGQNWNQNNTGQQGGWSHGNNGNWGNGGNGGGGMPMGMVGNSPLSAPSPLNPLYANKKTSNNLGWSAASSTPNQPVGGGRIMTGRIPPAEEQWEAATPSDIRTTHTVEISGGPSEPTVIARKETPQVERRIVPTTAFGGRQFIDLSDTVAPPESVMPEAASTWVDTPVQEDKSERREGFTITNRDRPYDEIVYDDGSVLRPADISGWESDWTAKRPYRFAYNPRTHKLFHLRTNDGRVHEVLQERTETMESYENHELDPELRERERQRKAEQGGKAIVDWTRMINLTPESSKPYALPSDEPTPASEQSTAEQATNALNSLPDPKVIGEVISAHDLLSAEAAAMTRHPELVKIAKNAPVEFYCEQVTPRLTVDNIHAVVQELAGSSSYEELREGLAKAREQHAADTAVWDLIESRLTHHVNHLLNVSFGIEWKIGSFSDDVLDLAAELENDYGPSVAEIFNNLTTHVIDQAICIAGKYVEEKLVDPPAESTEIDVAADATGAETDQAEVGADEEAVGNHVIAFQNRSSVTCIPYPFADLDVAFQGTSSVTKQDLPELYAVICAIFARTTDYPISFTGRYIKTLDNVWLRLDLACLVDDAYLITRHPVG